MADIKTAEELAAEQARVEAEAQAVAEAEAAKLLEPLAAKDAEIAKLAEERDNYKKVALKRLGKLPGDADFLESADQKTGLTVEEQVKKVLLEEEIVKAQKVKDDLIKDQAKKISELTLALKNRPSPSIGGGSGESIEVKDNVLTSQQIEVLRAKAIRLKADPEKFIENAKKNLLKNR